MRKGCFITIIVSLTVITLIIFYLFKFYGNDILMIGKDKVVELAEYKIFDDLDKLENKEYNDTLKILIRNYFKETDTLEIEKNLKRIGELTDNIEVIVRDSKIDSLEFDFIKTTIVKYDKRKKNRD